MKGKQMSTLIGKIKETKKTSTSIKTTIELEEEDAKAYTELLGYFPEKELLAVALEDPASLRKLLGTKQKEKIQINKSVDLNEVQDDALRKLKDEGFSISEIMTVAILKLNPKKELKAIKSMEEAEKNKQNVNVSENNNEQDFGSENAPMNA